MKVRGARECQSCGSQWSYYETGSIECPDCGSLRSVGIDERTEHTDSPVTLSLSPVVERIDGDALAEVATDAADRCQEYVRKRGFVDAGDLKPLDATYVAAVELRYVASELARSMRVSEEEELYFLSLLRGAEAGERPPPAEVPASLADARGLATAAVVDAYRRDLVRYLDEQPDQTARTVLGRIVDHKKRIEALDGAVEVATAETLLQALVDLSHYAALDDEPALASAQERLDSLSR
ncbi:DUF7117 family protein [Halapricum salinum]|uniref:TFIIB-type zinc ribbon-containing protein n=1 Tax=Halapricum salinum TaxID=1457250 RepID=A0A4D6HGJ5_9EURY|nr:hypothetical protein [Halapricum salinum]QCC52228.1 TFIIB-type zinc ribbon-containing protein [Halapricum salinum]